MADLPLIARAREHGERTALLAPEGEFTYRQLLDASARVAAHLLDGEDDLREQRVVFLTPPGFDYAAVQWGIWRAGGIAVPLCVSHPRPELEYAILDADAGIVVAHPAFEESLGSVAREHRRRFLTTRDALAIPPLSAGVPSHWNPPGPEPKIQNPESKIETLLPEVDESRRALILYTSGTTSRPKGVVTTHRNIAAQVTSLIEAWEWSPDDHLLHVLPLHHIHGIINGLTCALWAGACCQILPRFDAEVVWERLIADDLTLFMAVPTIYVKLIAAWEAASADRQRAMTAACAKLRLMVSGSAALPVPVMEKWRAISRQPSAISHQPSAIGHRPNADSLWLMADGPGAEGHPATGEAGTRVPLLERYGMTEIGMGLSNPLHGRRVAGHVGTPLPGVEVRLVDEVGKEVPEGTSGEIEVRGPGVFLEYWRKPEATEQAFRDGWFRTGDIAVVEDGSYRILGRESIDIIKTGGEKVSALEIEAVLLSHPSIAECAVVGIEDPEWGERVGAVVVTRGGATLALAALRAWARVRLAVYKIPTRLLVVDELPRNAMGKVTKPDLVRLFGAGAAGAESASPDDPATGDQQDS